MTDLLWRIDELAPQNGALATVVDVTRPAYRKPGARAVYGPDGSRVGMVSGGCLENDVAVRAQRVGATGGIEIVRYSPQVTGESPWGFGLGCGGSVEVLIEPLAWWRSAAAAAVREIAARQADRRAFVLATLLRVSGAPSTAVDRILVHPDGTVNGRFHRLRLEPRIAERAAAKLSAHDRSGVVRLASPEGEAEVFLDVVSPPPALLIFGAGNDVVPLVRMAAEIGLEVTVVDRRPLLATTARFPLARSVRCLAADEIAAAPFGEGSLVVVMSHDFDYDRAALAEALGRSHGPGYVGVLGPRSRTERLLTGLGDAGRAFREERLEVLRGPVGFDLGAESPAEIAVAIVAEIVAFLRRGRGADRRERPEIGLDGAARRGEKP